MFRRASLALFFLAAALAAEKPTVDQIFPAGAVRGSTNEITLLGTFEPWPPKAWASVGGLDFQFSTNKGKVQLAIAPDVPAGPCLVRVFNDEGASDLRIFVVTEAKETDEIEPNNHFARPQTVTNLPVTINGRLEKNGDVDSFALRMKAGDWLDASLDCYTLMAKLDPVLRLVTTNGYQLAWNHDFSSLDPRLIWQAPYDLTAVLQVFGFAYPAESDIRLSGGRAGVYRLHLSLSDHEPADRKEAVTEKEPNGITNNAPMIGFSAEVIGAICPVGDQDRFKIDLKKDQAIEVQLKAASIGSPLDAWLAIEDPSGKELVRNDDADNSRDPRIEWKVPEDGAYFLAAGSVTHQGTADWRYHLSVRSLAPDYRITSSADALVLTAGTTNTLKLNCRRLRGFTNDLVATVRGLPAELTPQPAPVPAKDGELWIQFSTATNAPPFNGPFKVIIADKQTRDERTTLFDLVSRTENNGVPGGYAKLLIESTSQFWFTVKPLVEKKAEEKK